MKHTALLSSITTRTGPSSDTAQNTSSNPSPMSRHWRVSSMQDSGVLIQRGRSPASVMRCMARR